jgi:hypothetical protein
MSDRRFDADGAGVDDKRHEPVMIAGNRTSQAGEASA